MRPSKVQRRAGPSNHGRRKGSEVWTRSFDYSPLEERERHSILLINIVGQIREKLKRNLKKGKIKIKSTNNGIFFEWYFSNVHVNQLWGGVSLNYRFDSVGLESQVLDSYRVPKRSWYCRSSHPVLSRKTSEKAWSMCSHYIPGNTSLKQIHTQAHYRNL